MAREVRLELPVEAAVELHVRVVGLAALGAGGVEPALEPEQQCRDQVALHVGDVAVGRQLELVVQGPQQQLEALALASGTSIERPHCR